MTDDLEIFTPTPRVLTIQGRTISILPLKVAKLSAFTKAVMPIGGSLMAGDLTTPFVQGFEHLRAAISIGANVEEAWLDDLDADDFLMLGMAVIETNAAFFHRRLMPALAKSAQGFKTAMTARGAASSQP